MSENIILESAVPNTTESIEEAASEASASNKNNNIATPTPQPAHSYQEFVHLRKEINQLKASLQEKYQELAAFRENIAEKKILKRKVIPQANKLNSLTFNLPNFLVIGVQKGGTTWLHENLKRHPEIFLPSGRKELEFFSYYDKKIADIGLTGYLKYFNQFKDLIQPNSPKAIGEATPSYFWSTNPGRKWTKAPKYFNERIPESVHNLLGSNLKLILCLRDPVERAISAYFHHIKRDRIDYKTQSILDVGHLYGIIDMGFYSQHLDRWLEKYTLDNFKVLIYERDIKQNKEKTIKHICKFLEVDHQLFPTSANLNKYHNRGLRYTIEADGVYLINPDCDERNIVISQDELQQLRSIYREDYLALQKTLNTDLSPYWKFD